MPFDPMGRFVPQIQQAGQMATQPTAANPNMQPMAQNQFAMQNARPAIQTQQAMNPQFQSMAQRPQMSMPMQNAQQGRPAQTQAGQPPAQLGLQSGQPAQLGGQNYSQMIRMPQQGMPSGFGYAQGQPMPGGQSVEQSVQSGNPQSVQNFMSALNQVGAGSNNNMMNGVGQQGAGPVGGFQGFQQNGYGNAWNQGQAGAAMGGNAYGGNNGWQMNMAQQQQGGQAWNQATQGQLNNTIGAWGGDVYGNGGTGGVQGQPQWQTPQPWGQPLNNMGGTPGSGYNSPSDSLNNPPFGSQGGAFYTNQPTVTGQGGYFGPNPNVAGGSNPNQQTWTPGQYWNMGQGPAFSDERVKTNIKSGDKDLEEFLDALGVYSYEYKDPKYGEGRRISPMAQEIEKSPLGQAAISTNPEGYKMVDYGKLAGTQLAALALLLAQM